MPRTATLKQIILITFSLLLSHCAVGPNFQSPDLPPVDDYTETPLPRETVSTKGMHGGKKQHFAYGEDVCATWWELFHSPALNEMIQRGFDNSPTLDAARAALVQAQQNMRAQWGALLLPALSAQGSGQRQQFTGASFGSPNNNPTIFNIFNAQVDVSYTFDIFGGSRREIEGLCALIDYQRFQLEAAYLTISTNIVTSVITEASLRDQIQATKDLVQFQEKILNITKKQFELGAQSRTAVLAQETQLAQTSALLPPLEKSLAQTRHTLAVLMGEFPCENTAPSFNLASLTLPAELPISLPSELVRQRPDIRASEALLHQASAQIGVATAALFPQVTLTGNVGWQANQLNDLIGPPTNIWSIATNIVQPIFQGGSLIAKRRSAIAAYDQAEAQYRQVVLQAFQNVADTLRALESDAQALNILTQAENAARDTLKLTEEQFRLGAVNYVNLLVAQQQVQQTMLNRIRAQALRYSDTATLYSALGGGWWNF
ncbi:efflux transporter outer membrane subunit [Candidatus Berkiella aquae]|uniref:Efflux transporter outer membrane subunit n=1 Tax=Candidatus Berkiella aquae TaxID=295108 RepID=A0A0Q9YJK2_9GAMM|nr:efflux transporter outer membrane subunit [Candidatus Berkiella aquae]MCS5711308.1 efflux transporter outer membrane subunit [Candidatus Berkiella aquae]